jgi:thymidylate kinase
MKILIIEGIAASGKTTIINSLQILLSEKGVDFLVIDEKQTLMPILKKRDKENNLEFTRELLKNVLKNKKEIIIFDRFYLSHVYRSGCQVKDFESGSELLRPFNPVFVLLTIDKNKIKKRVFDTAKHRNLSWSEFIKEKGKDEDEIAEYYIDQQNDFLKLVQDIEFESIEFDTTDYDFDKVSREIYQKYLGT